METFSFAGRIPRPHPLNFWKFATVTDRRYKTSVRFLFLNQYFPPDPAPTGLLFRELGDHLSALGHEVESIASGQNYRADKSRKRMVRETRALTSIFFRGLRARRPHVVISGTSPPCLLVAAALVAKWHRAKSVHWSMDLYPELALALGEMRPGILARCLESLMGWAYRRTDRVVALDEDMALHLQQYGVKAEVIAPWLPAPAAAEADLSTIHHPSSAIPAWIYSGNLGRAHEWTTLLEAQALLEKRGSPWRLIFQGGGTARPFAQARARELNLTRCEWKDYASENELRASLLACHAVVATQKPETRGLLWPSKLALLRDLPRPLIWVGSLEGAIARELRTWPHAGVFAPGQARELADWMERWQTGEKFKVSRAADAVGERAQALEKWALLLNRLD